MPRLTLFFQLFLCSCTLFATVSCDDPTAANTMKYSEDVCNTAPAFVTEMQSEKGPQDMAPPEESCAPESAFGRQFTLAPPRSGELVLHVASDYTGYYFLTVYGRRGDETFPLSECLTSKAIHEVLHVPTGREKLESLLIEVRYETGRILEANPKDAFISLMAYDGAPKASEEAAKKGYRDDCGDGGTNCYVLSTCDRGMNLEQWARELGLVVTDAAGGERGAIVNACVPEGFSLQTTTPPRNSGGKVKSIERDTTQGEMERNFFIEVEEITPNPGFGELSDKQILEAFPCMEYQPRNGDGDDVIVTIIDSGVDASDLSFRPWDKYAARRSFGRYLPRGGYGYDFVNDDPKPDDELNHGTYVGGALINDYRGKERLTVVHHKIFDGAGRATYFGAIESIYGAIDHKTNILSLSWGITDPNEPVALRCAIEEAMKNEVIVVTSAGNAATDIDRTPQWPAAWTGQRNFPTLFSVGSFWHPNLSKREVSRADYSNFGVQRVSVYGYLAMLVPEYRRKATTMAFGTSISVPLVVSNLAERYRRGSSRTRPEVLNERGSVFFPSWRRDAAGNPIRPHDVEYVPVRCAGKAP
ncbi:S8 family serine peptidase [Lewinella sp. 4G2]|uniref:S8 family serine peptidase n=1 Tax=Lewinella sp. 4G2 TaxID=1803372 RepID=UPI0007B494CB|nr:S8 family serine peptidase [Lewinella sp. 4G2]OAV43340.1 hypothetical protein A3850_001995 [Lewinella sp. 4G2]